MHQHFKTIFQSYIPLQVRAIWNCLIFDFPTTGFLLTGCLLKECVTERFKKFLPMVTVSDSKRSSRP